MFYSHRFSHAETLARASYWLKELGFDPARMWIDPRARRLNCDVGLGQYVKVHSIISALEQADFEGRMESWEPAGLHLNTAESPEPQSRPGPHAPAHWPIGWHPEAPHAGA